MSISFLDCKSIKRCYSNSENILSHSNHNQTLVLNLPKMSFANMIFNFVNGSMNNITFFPGAFEESCIYLKHKLIMKKIDLMIQIVVESFHFRNSDGGYEFPNIGSKFPYRVVVITFIAKIEIAH